MTRTSPPRPDGCSTCARRHNRRPLGPDDYVISADEKTSIQGRDRKHPTTPSAPGQTMRVEHEYHRRGALAYLAAWDVHHAKVFGRCEATSGIKPFSRLVDDVMTVEPYASAHRVFWVSTTARPTAARHQPTDYARHIPTGA